MLFLIIYEINGDFFHPSLNVFVYLASPQQNVVLWVKCDTGKVMLSTAMWHLFVHTNCFSLFMKLEVSRKGTTLEPPPA